MDSRTQPHDLHLRWLHVNYDLYAACRDAERPDMAAEVCRKVLALTPDDVEWRLRLARNCLDQGQFGEAVSSLDIAARYARCDEERSLIHRLFPSASPS